MAAPTIGHIDHLVLTVRDISLTVEFYVQVLGMRPVTFQGGRLALAFGRQKINLHQAGREFDLKAMNPTPGAADICVITETPMADVVDHLAVCGVTIEEGPVQRAGAEGLILSVFFRDPDGNIIEVANSVAG